MSTGTVALALLAISSVSYGQGWLDAPRLLEIAEGGEVSGLGDFEGDGDEDLIWFAGEPGAWTGVRVFFNDGAGEFTAGPLTALSGERWPYRERFRDFTGDGLADALVQQRNIAEGAGVEVWPGQSDGSFGAAHFLPFNVAPEDVAVGNADGDPAFELATRQSDNGFSDAPQWVRWWDYRSGTFVGSPEIALPGTGSGAGVADLVAIDIGNDGVDDLVAGELVGDRLMLLPTVNGAPTYGSFLTVPLPTATKRIYPLVGDLEGDGDDDIVCSVQGSFLHVVSVLQTAGTFTAGAEQEFSTWSWIEGGRPTALADWDADGDLDLLSHNGNVSAGADEGTLVLFENDGGHVFAEVARVLTGIGGDEAEPGPGATDLDGDGRADYAGIRSITFGAGRFEDVLQESLGFASSVGPSVVFDEEGDGDLDVVRAAPPLFGQQLLLNDATAAFAPVASLPAAPTGQQYGPAAAIADLTGDGRVDLLVPLQTEGGPFDPSDFLEMRLLAGLAVGGFSDVGGPATPGEAITAGLRGLLPVADLDGDGDLDLLDRHGRGELGGWWENDGTGSLAPFAALFDGEPLLALDAEGDGDLDVLTHGTAPNRLELERQGSAFTFAPEDVFTGAYSPSSAALAKLDADGDLDLILGEVIGGPVEILVFENDAGTFTLRGSLPAVPNADEVLGADDIDGDGLIDLVAARSYSQGSEADRLEIYRATAAFDYEPARAFLSRRVVGFDDLDGDGDLDAWGQDVVRSRRFDGPDDGLMRQYGVGGAGSGGAVPVLGATGPVRTGSTTARLNVVRGLSGAPAWLAVGNSSVELIDVPFPGLTLFVDPLSTVLSIPLPGPAGAGEGALSIPLTAVLNPLAGLTRTFQVVVLDPGSATGLAFTNGLQVVFGL